MFNKVAWKKLKRIPKTTMTKVYRFGLLSPVAGKEYGNSDNKIKCLACEGKFTIFLDAQTHPCLAEKEFRLYTGRHEGALFNKLMTKDLLPTLGRFVKPMVTTPFSKITIPVSKQEPFTLEQHQENISLTIDPEKWVLWNYELLMKIKSLEIDSF